MKDFLLVLDFDSTFVKVEALEELASISLSNDPEKEHRIEKLKEMTSCAMNGKASYSEILSQKMPLLKASRKHMEPLCQSLSQKITPSILRNRQFLSTYANQIYVLSGGFKEFICPVVEKFGIPSSQVFANEFHFDADGCIVGLDQNNPLSQDNGKTLLLDSLNLRHPHVFIIGDGYTDYEAAQSSPNRKFLAFTENVTRSNVVAHADEVVHNFDEVIALLQNHPSFSFSYQPLQDKVLLLENIHPATSHSFTSAGFDTELVSTALSHEDLCKKIEDVTVLGVRSGTRIDSEVLKHAHKLLAIGCFCIGTDQVDLEGCLERGIAVFNAPYSNTRSVVELAMGEIIMLERKIFERSNQLHRGFWNKSAFGSVEIRRKKLGILGYGNIGAQLSVLAEAMGMQVYFYDALDKLPLGNAVKCDSLLDLLSRVDVLSIHVNGEKENKHLIDTEELEAMRPDSILLNLSRGDVVNLEALHHFLENKKLKGAAIDVFPHEPKKSGPFFESLLQNLPNVILTPHIGGSTLEAQENTAHFVSKSILNYIQNGSSQSSVNFPEAYLPAMSHSHRLIHLHKNVSGMLAHISSTLAEHQINIEGQYLKTNESVGYAIVDTNSPFTPELIEELKNIPHTIRVRSIS